MIKSHCLICPIHFAMSILKINKWPDNWPAMHRNCFCSCCYYADNFSNNKYETNKYFSM